MRIYSTPQSAEQGEVSILAIVETLVAMGITIWIAVHYQTVVHVAISGCIAPFLLLRTKKSTNLALSWFEEAGIGSRIMNRTTRLFDQVSGPEQRIFTKIIRLPLNLPLGILALSVILLLFPAARAASTIFAAFQHPTEAFRAVASNWRRIVWATDSCVPPEVLPGIETTACSTYLSEFRFQEVIDLFRKLLGISNQLSRWDCLVGCLLWPLLFGVIFVMLYLPSLLYRFSLKSTSILYMPFLFIIRSHIGEDLSATERIRDIKFGAIEQLQWWYAWVILIANCGSLLMLSGQVAILNNTIDDGGPMIALLFDLFLPTNGLQLTLKAWHIGRFANAAICIWLFYFADRAERRLESGRWSETQVTKIFEALRQVQVVLSLYTTACALSRFIQFALYAKLPSVEWEFVP